MPFPQPHYIFAVCQAGAEKALKAEVGVHWPELRFAFSRPGLVTFKLPETPTAAQRFELNAVFARTWGFSLDTVRGASVAELAEKLWLLIRHHETEHLHVWQRDLQLPGDHGFEPGPTPASLDAIAALQVARPKDLARWSDVPINRTAHSEERVINCVLVEPDQWLVGWHTANLPPSRWPGGAPTIARPPEMISRAYLKVSEALLWSRLPIKPGDRVVEIGSSPGGSCQALLDRGLVVVGVDPAEMDPRLLARPGFTHVRARAIQMKRRLFRGFRWLTADLNTAPNYTLDTVEAIVTHRDVKIRGLILTLKLIEWEMASQIGHYLDRIRSWGYSEVAVRQLAHNRQEICVAALRE